MEANYFTILYWFCHTSTWIHHGCTRAPHPEPPSHLPPCTISPGHPSAPAPSILYPASNLDWRFVGKSILESRKSGLKSLRLTRVWLRFYYSYFIVRSPRIKEVSHLSNPFTGRKWQIQPTFENSSWTPSLGSYCLPWRLPCKWRGDLWTMTNRWNLLSR